MISTRRSFLARTALAGAASPLFAQKGAPGPAPNIVLVLANGLPSWVLGCYGNTEIRTPNIDRIALGGTRFINSFACTPTSSPSAATLFSGRTPMQHGLEDFLTTTPSTNPDQGQAAPPASFSTETLFTDLLAQAGYKNGYVGKWHLGGDANPGHGISYAATIASAVYQNPSLTINGKSVDEKGYLPEILTRRALEFLDQQQKGSPFSLTVAYHNPHKPYDGHPQKYYDLYKDSRFESFFTQPAAPTASRDKDLLSNPIENLRKCAASITALDDQIPALQRKLLDKGLFDNTIFIFTSTNGMLLGRHGLWGNGHGSNPINMFDEVVGVPMIWQWPGRVPVQSQRPELVDSTDFLLSLCDAAGLKPPAAKNLSGRSYLPLVTNRPLPKKEPWKQLVFGHFRNTEMARDNYFKVVIRNNGQGPNELYDLRKDPRERVNQYDNPSFVTVRDNLAKQLAEWRQKYA